MIDIKTVVDELDEASTEEGTELGEYWRGLCRFWRVVQYGGNSELVNTIRNELYSQYEWLKQNFTWVEHEEVSCDECGKGCPAYRELVWNEELEND
jgi:hypothetical protein